jgi:predicted lipoprotein with Yx(FWY)xxD motif
MTISRTKGTTYAVALAAVATLAAACGSSSSGGGGGSQSVSSGSGGGSTASSNASALTTQSTSIGSVVADAKGRTVYELVGDPVSNTKCTGACLSIWPPVMSGGKIAVVHGHPVFTFAGDSAKGQTKGQGVKDTWGLWLALNPKGQPISASSGATAPSPSQSAASSGGGGGGYGY